MTVTSLSPLFISRLKASITEEVVACNGDRAKLRALFEVFWETRNHGFCCDHITTEDGNSDDLSVDFCIDNAIERRHVDCLAQMLMLRAIEDEVLRDAVITNEPL